VTRPPPLATHVAIHADCSRPLSQIGIPGDQHNDALKRDDLLGIATSPTGCTIVVWTWDEVMVSRDDGLTFVTLPRRATDDTSAAVDRDAIVYVARDGVLEVVDTAGTITRRPLPDRTLHHIAATGRWLVLRSEHELAASDDAGITWHVVPLPVADITSAAVHITDDDAVHLAVATAREPLRYFTGNLRAGTWRAIWSPPAKRPYTDPANPTRPDPYQSISAFAFGADGTLYAERYDAYGFHVFAVTGDGRFTTTDKLVDRTVLLGATIYGIDGILEARDAHDYPLALWRGQGPVRITDDIEHVYGACCRDQGRWLVGSVVTE